MKVLKEILFVDHDEHASERNKVAVIIFHKFLKKLQEEKKDYAFLYAWQWFLSITKNNRYFRTMVRQHRGIFEYLTVITPQSLCVYRNRIFDGTYRF